MPTILEQFTGREHTPLVQFIKYAICGGIATATSILLFYLCAYKVMPSLWHHHHAGLWLEHHRLVDDQLPAPQIRHLQRLTAASRPVPRPARQQLLGLAVCV